MTAILIKDLPPQVHRRLKEAARKNRRSMTRQAVVILEDALLPPERIKWPKPIKPRFPLTDEWLRKAVREGRA